MQTMPVQTRNVSEKRLTLTPIPDQLQSFEPGQVVQGL